jgi:hypothetical protein
MQTECTDRGSAPHPIVQFQCALDQIAATLEGRVTDDGDLWMPMASSQQPI